MKYVRREEGGQRRGNGKELGKKKGGQMGQREEGTGKRRNNGGGCRKKMKEQRCEGRTE